MRSFWDRDPRLWEWGKLSVLVDGKRVISIGRVNCFETYYVAKRSSPRWIAWIGHKIIARANVEACSSFRYLLNQATMTATLPAFQENTIFSLRLQRATQGVTCRIRPIEWEQHRDDWSQFPVDERGGLMIAISLYLFMHKVYGIDGSELVKYRD